MPERRAEAGFWSESRRLTTLAVPIALTQLAQVALTTTDTVMMGLINTTALAAGGLAIVLFNQVRTMGVGLVTAVGNQVAAANARDSADRPAQLKDLVRAGLVVATGAGALGTAVLIGLGYALVWFGQDPVVVELVQQMFLALAPGLLPCLWFQVLRQYTVGMRRPQALVWITVASIAVNAGLNWGFIHGTGFLPQLGLTGIGLSTSLVYLLSFSALYLITRRNPVLTPMLSLQVWRVRAATVRRSLSLGVPIAATYGSEAGFFLVVALVMGSFGASALAAHTVVNQLVYIVFQGSIGLSQAASISVSGEVAVGRADAAARVSRLALIHGAAVMVIVAVVYLVAPGAVLRFFLDPADSTTFGIASTLLMIAALMQFFDCAQNIGVGLLRGMDDTKSGFRLTVIGYWLVGLPAVGLLGLATGAGPIGVWLGLMCGLAVTAVLLLHRFTTTLAERRRLMAYRQQEER
jgi:MATE family multidrug resistance protein